MSRKEEHVLSVCVFCRWWGCHLWSLSNHGWDVLIKNVKRCVDCIMSGVKFAVWENLNFGQIQKHSRQTVTNYVTLCISAWELCEFLPLDSFCFSCQSLDLWKCWVLLQPLCIHFKINFTKVASCKFSWSFPMSLNFVGFEVLISPWKYLQSCHQLLNVWPVCEIRLFQISTQSPKDYELHCAQLAKVGT